MADDRRRELRRRRILENSEARREKIFGVTKSTKLLETNAEVTSGRPSDVAFTPAFATSTPLPNTNGGPVVSQHVESQGNNLPSTTQSKSSSLSTNYSSTPVTSRENTQLPPRVNTNDLFVGANGPNDGNPPFQGLGNLIGSRNGTQRNRLNRSPIVNDPRLSNTEDFTLGSSFDLNTDTVAATAKLSDHALLPCFLALLVCFFLCIGLEDVVFNSLVIPFVLFEGQRALWQAWQERSEGPGNGGPGGGGGAGLLNAALLLCGVPQHLTMRYLSIAATLRRLSSSFALYLVTVVLWQFIIGLPQGTKDLHEQTAAAMGHSEQLSDQTMGDTLLNT